MGESVGKAAGVWYFEDGLGSLWDGAVAMCNMVIVMAIVVVNVNKVKHLSNFASIVSYPCV